MASENTGVCEAIVNVFPHGTAEGNPDLTQHTWISGSDIHNRQPTLPEEIRFASARRRQREERESE